MLQRCWKVAFLSLGQNQASCFPLSLCKVKLTVAWLQLHIYRAYMKVVSMFSSNFKQEARSAKVPKCQTVALGYFFSPHRSFAMCLQDRALRELASLFLISGLLTDVLSSPNNQPRKWGEMFSLCCSVGTEKRSGKGRGGGESAEDWNSLRCARPPPPQAFPGQVSR